ncbi:MAG TPA: lyase family protein, partial [Ferruginibacter sp.]|nr:lyase family protein [Ferruginibacter sp.]
MQLSPLTAISPIDGRYNKASNQLATYFSEYALIKYRLHVEVEYFILLGEKKFFKNNASLNKQLRLVVNDFSLEDATVIKNTEAITNHDVKAVEYFLKNKLEELGAGAVKEWVHFGLTSQDINNTAIPMLWKDAIEQEYLPSVINLQHNLYQLAKQWENIPMLARTHGQAASPTR